MHYPIWEVPVLGGGMVIALVATIHVVIAHFAVGAGFFVAVSESRLARRPDPLLRDFLRRFAAFLILFSFVAGALTGVGIWLSIGLVSPRATSALIHTYVWGWAAEWCLFVVEIAAGYCYYYGRGRLSPARLRAVAWIYAWSAWGSLFIINGIISFMLSPGDWVQTHKFWDGFFNPTFWSSTLLRTISALSLAGIFVAIVANGCRAYEREQARRIINQAAWFLAPPGPHAPALDLVLRHGPARGPPPAQGRRHRHADVPRLRRRRLFPRRHLRLRWPDLEQALRQHGDRCPPARHRHGRHRRHGVRPRGHPQAVHHLRLPLLQRLDGRQARGRQPRGFHERAGHARPRRHPRSQPLAHARRRDRLRHGTPRPRAAASSWPSVPNATSSAASTTSNRSSPSGTPR